MLIAEWTVIGFFAGVLFTLSLYLSMEIRRVNARYRWLKPQRTKSRREMFVEVLVMSKDGWALIGSRLRGRVHSG